MKPFFKTKRDATKAFVRTTSGSVAIRSLFPAFVCFMVFSGTSLGLLNAPVSVAQEVAPQNQLREKQPTANPTPTAELANTNENESGSLSQSLADVLMAGGPTLIPIYIASFILVVVVFERTVSLRRGRILPRHFVRRLLHQLEEGSIDREDALTRCKENSTHIAFVFEAGIRKWGKPAVEVEQAILDAGERTANTLRKYIRVINGVATVCPLMGLLGTVLGMMQAFNDISSSSAIGRPELLAGGISEALVSTAAGMFVAIPALILNLYFIGRVDGLVMDIDAKGQDLVNLISAEGLADLPKPKAKAKAKTARKKAA